MGPLSLVERLSSSQRFVLQAKNAANKVTDVCVCKPLVLDAMVSEVHQNNQSYVLELSDSNFPFTILHGEPQQTTELSKLGGERLRQDGHLPGATQ